MKTEEVKKIFDIMMTHQAVFKNDILTEQLVVKLLVVTGQEYLNLEFETVQNPKPEILMQSKLQFSKKRVFDYIQTLQ